MTRYYAVKRAAQAAFSLRMLSALNTRITN